MVVISLFCRQTKPHGLIAALSPGL